ncbi:Nramp family divalent metal transporter [Carboxylicivirga marina]|uniref:Nramp family divalent metal transporter n=1 Tax=Carboxylicivirga marina TaxID=2800988 RepID=A0ABS1HLP1_9BACT|nr:Nramp family divalent metal transporter [Carboxylicivirga marina]MBK3518586.1 Nramp family divalent metal transporter [Carboxylicivirga marina]
MEIIQRLKQIGPGILVTAAFIGPGTITTCSITGAGFGYALLWGLLFSIIATIVLQEMTARLGLVGQMGLGKALRLQFNNPIVRYLTAGLVLSAILIGNAAYETGNILGASMGMVELSGVSSIQMGELSVGLWGPVIGLLAFILLEMGSYKRIEKMIIGLVLLMSFAFITTAIVVGPHMLEVLKGMFVPSMPDGSFYLLMGLIGTTVVPYNLFLHASSVREKWKNPSDLKIARTDLLFSILLGGFISMSIVITAAATFYGSGIEIKGAGDLASQLTPVLGSWAGVFMALGLFAAGISSAITAPLAAAYATSGILGFKPDLKSQKFKWIWRAILLIGILFSAIGYSPIKAIVFAQFANGLLLPFIAIFLLIVMNNKQILESYTNNKSQNLLAIIVVLIALGLGIKSLTHVMGLL